ncbi:MAG TPA: HlyD family type I secretion periplasmic adaptor subunit [Methylothermaceae bacterium]|nr:HlyD family type I secretion periplasmic adaptor subunit [Methylothermaceae bacterium]
MTAKGTMASKTLDERGKVVTLSTPPAPKPQDPFREGRRLTRIGLLLLLTTFGGIGLWAALAPLQGAVILRAQVQVDQYRKVVKPLEGGIVKAIRVREGDRVEAGQPLILLEDVSQRATVELLRRQRDALRIRAARLHAERRHAGELILPEDIRRRASEPAVARLIEAETAVFEAQRQMLAGQTELLRREIAHARAEVAALNDERAAIDRNLVLLRDELRRNRGLYEKGLLPYVRILTLQRAVAQKQERRGAIEAQIARTRQRISELELRILSLQEHYAKKAADELKDLEARLASLEERLRPAEDALRRRVITAPIAGEVVNLRVHTVGTAVAPYQELLEIVPQGARLILEGRLRPEDIDEVTVGKRAEIRFTAFKQRTTPTVAGRVIYVSADALRDEQERQSYYQVRIAIDGASLKRLEGLRLTPGMTATVFIQTRARTALQYLLEPVTDTLRRALRES